MQVLIILLSTLIVINLIILYYVTRPKIIELEKEIPGIKRQVVMTPQGTFQRIEKRDPVYNDDETLFIREDGDRQA